MRVAVLGPTHPFRGGIAHHTTLLAGALREQHDVLFVSFREQYPPWLFPGRSDRDPSTPPGTIDAEYRLAPLRPWTWWLTARRIADFGPRVTVVPWWVPYWAPSVGIVARLLRRWKCGRVVFICHNVTPHEGGGLVGRVLSRFALRSGHAYIVHSDAEEAALSRLLGPGARREATVRRALLPIHAVAPTVDRLEARLRLGIGLDDPVALFFGFVRPYKGLEHLIEALALAAKDVPAIRLIVAGEFWSPACGFRALAASRGVADRLIVDDRYIPNEEMGIYFGAADVVVLPYVDATQSGVITVAAQHGVPVIVTRVGGLPDAVIDGVTGFVVPPGDERSLADALCRVLGDPLTAQRLREGVAANRSRFDWSALVGIIEDLANPAAAPVGGLEPPGSVARMAE